MKEATQFSHLTLRDRIQIQIGLETGKLSQKLLIKLSFIVKEFIVKSSRTV